jgi:hypothetical protein
MGCVLALRLVASLVHVASLDAELGLRAEGQSNTLAAADVADRTRGAWSAVPSASVLADAWRLRLETTYAPRFWTSDAELHPSPLVSHNLTARVETRTEGSWRAEASASAARGMTDPLANVGVVASGTAARTQLATTAPLRFEELRTGARAELTLGPRTTVAAGAAGNASRAIGAAGPELLPLQRGLALDASVSRLATERDTVRVSAQAGRTLTDTPAGETTADVASGLATWRRRLTPFVDGWIGGGASIATSDAPPDAGRVDVLPNGEAGIAREGDELSVATQVVVRLTTSVDRFSGAIDPTVDATASIAWRIAQGVSGAGSASGGGRTDGESASTAAEVRVTWALRERLALEAGIRGRWQYERRPEIPSFFEGATFAGVTWNTGRLFGTVAP